MYKEIKGDLIELALNGEFDVIAHGCNCFCTMGAGIAVAMKNTFECDNFGLEQDEFIGDMNKLGCIDWEEKEVYSPDNSYYSLIVVNAYTQYNYGRNHSDGKNIPVYYEALALCMRKINHVFKGRHIGLPQIGCGLAGGDWDVVKEIIQWELRDCNVTIVIYNK